MGWPSQRPLAGEEHRGAIRYILNATEPQGTDLLKGYHKCKYASCVFMMLKTSHNKTLLDYGCASQQNQQSARDKRCYLGMIFFFILVFSPFQHIALCVRVCEEILIPIF